MKTTLFGLVALLAGLALIAGAPTARAADEDIPSFRKRGDMEKQFVESVGIAIVKAARSNPTKIELDKYEFEDPKKDRKDLKITMNWVGAATKKKYQSTIVVKIDSSDKDKWEVLNIAYTDDNNVSIFKPNQNKIQELVKKFNKEK